MGTGLILVSLRKSDGSRSFEEKARVIFMNPGLQMTALDHGTIGDVLDSVNRDPVSKLAEGKPLTNRRTSVRIIDLGTRTQDFAQLARREEGMTPEVSSF